MELCQNGSYMIDLLKIKENAIFTQRFAGELNQHPLIHWKPLFLIKHSFHWVTT